jgi:hypothetical protein
MTILDKCPYQYRHAMDILSVSSMNAYLELLLKAAAQPFSRFVSLDPGPCRLKGGGGKKCIYVAAGLERAGMLARRVVLNARYG